MSVENVNEGETAYLTVKFYNKADALEAPSTISYRIDCLKNSQEVKADTPVTPAASEVEITITPTYNNIIDQANLTERRLVTITGTYGADDAVVKEYEYNVKNMRKKALTGRIETAPVEAVTSHKDEWLNGNQTPPNEGRPQCSVRAVRLYHNNKIITRGNAMNSPLAYIGGKSQLSKRIIERIPKHKTYCEVFAGAAWVFFRKDFSKYEKINDLDGELITFYRILQNHLEEFLKQFKWLLSSREIFKDWKRQQEAGGLTDIQQAARYYYLQRHTFGRTRT